MKDKAKEIISKMELITDKFARRMMIRSDDASMISSLKISIDEIGEFIEECTQYAMGIDGEGDLLKGMEEMIGNALVTKQKMLALLETLKAA